MTDSARTRRLFIVEPDETLARALLLYLKGAPFEVVLFRGARAALTAAQGAAPVAALLSIDEGTPEAATEVRAFTAGVGCPVVLMSRFASDRGLFAGGIQQVGAAGHLHKPFTRERAVATIGEIIGERLDGEPAVTASFALPAVAILSGLAAIPLTVVVSTVALAARLDNFFPVCFVALWFMALMPLAFHIMGVVRPHQRSAGHYYHEWSVFFLNLGLQLSGIVLAIVLLGTMTPGWLSYAGYALAASYVVRTTWRQARPRSPA